MRYEYPSHEVMVVNLLDHYESSEGDGLTWYRESKRYARELSRTYGGGVGRAAGIIAALSPQVQWSVNKRLAEQVMRTGSTEEGCIEANAMKAYRIWMGERPLRVLGGPKVRAFYRAMMGDEDAAVIDTWMLQAVQWPRQGCSAKQYDRVAAALREAAARVEVPTASFQAVVWTHVRGGGE
jgi:hypothetical protein